MPMECPHNSQKQTCVCVWGGDLKEKIEKNQTTGLKKYMQQSTVF